MPNCQEKPDQYRWAIERAKELVAEAIATLDAARAPSDIAAHLDFAMHRMDVLIG